MAGNFTRDQVRAAVAPLYRDTVRIGGLGDSLTKNAIVNTGTTFLNHAPDGYLTWLMAHLQGGAEFTGYYCQGGKTTQQLYEDPLFLQAALDGPERDIFYCSGMNDVIGGISPSVTQQFYRETVEKLIDKGKRVRIATLPARVNTSASTDGAAWRAHNDFSANLAAKLGLRCLDHFQITVDPASTKYDVRSGMNFDPNHINNRGSYYCGKADAAALQSEYPSRIILPRTQAESWATAPTMNLLDNPLFITTGGVAGIGVNGNASPATNASIPLGYTVQRGAGTPTVTATLEDWTDPVTGLVFGKQLKLVITASAAGDRVDLLSDEITTRINANLATSYRAVIGAKLESPVNVSTLWLRQGIDSGNGASTYWGTSTNALVALTEGFDVPLVTPRMRPAAQLNATPLNALRASVLFSAAGTATVYWRAPAVQPASAFA